MRNKFNKDGFTIIELLVVIIIMGVLIGIAIVSYINLIERAHLGVCLSNQKTIEKARVYHYVHYDNYGENMEEIVVSLNLIGLIANDLVCPSGGTYIFAKSSPEVSCSIERHNP